MKKIIIFFSCILLFVGAAFSQNSVVVSDQYHGNTTIKSLLKEYRYPSTITCILSEGNSSTFIYADQTMQTKEFTVPNLEVNDIVISLRGTDGLSDTVYFCGKDLSSGYATFGFFNIYNAFNGTGPVSLHNMFLTGDGLSYVTELTRMISYKEGINTHYACIGKDERDFPCLVNLTGDYSTIWTYKTGTVIYDPYETPETMFDIKKVYSYPHDYIVTAGMDYGYGRYLNLRVFDPNDIFAPSGIHETKHIFCIDTAFGVEWDKDDVLLRQIEDGFFATVSYLKPGFVNRGVPAPETAPMLNGVHIGVFKINSLLSGSLSGMITSAVCDLLSLGGNTLTWFVNGPDGTLAFQEKITNVFGNESSTFCEVDFGSTMDVSAVRKFHTSGDIYCGLDSYSNRNRYVMSGFEESNPSILKYGMETFMSEKTCHVPVKYNYIYTNPYRSVNKEKEFTVRTMGSVFREVAVEPIRHILTTECEN